MQEGDRGERDSREGWKDNGTGDERSRCDRRNDEGKKGSEIDVTKQKSITMMMAGRKEAGKKGTTEIAAGEKSATREMQNGGATLKQ